MKKNLFSDIISMLGRYRARLSLALFMLIISNGLLIVNPLLFRQAVVAMDPAAGQPIGPFAWVHTLMGSYDRTLAPWIFLLIGIAATSAILKYHMRVAFISVSRDEERVVRMKIFERLQAQTKAFYDRHGIGELLSRLTNDVSAYRDVLGPGIMYPLFFTTLVTPGMIALFLISPFLASLSLIPLLTIPILNATVRKHIYRTSLEVQKQLAVMSNMVQEYFSGIRIVKSYVIENATLKHFSALCSDFLRLSIKLSCLQGLLYPFFTLLTKIITILLVVFSGFIIFYAWEELTIADFLSFMWIQSYIFFPILMLAWVLPIYERGRAAYDRLVEIYNEPIEVTEGPRPDLRITANANITLNHLTFTYPFSSFPVLSDINLEIKGGSFIGITGPVGSGKSTLLRLLNREYEIPHSMIVIGEHDIREYPLEAFSQAMVSVEQIPFLFSKSIAENVRFGREEASPEELETVSRYADLHETILDFPDQYDTLIGERGVKLSGGQKQRVAMARAFLVNRHILLLDDIFSAVDLATEKRIFHAMKKNFAGKTILLISHRISILEQLDRVIYLMNGKVVEDGTPAELLEKKGYFAALAELQKLGEAHS